MHLGEHLQETYTIQVNRDVTRCLRRRIIIQTLAKHTNTESVSGSPRRLMYKTGALPEIARRGAWCGISETVAGSPYTPPLPLGSRSAWYTHRNI